MDLHLHMAGMVTQICGISTHALVSLFPFTCTVLQLLCMQGHTVLQDMRCNRVHMH